MVVLWRVHQVMGQYSRGTRTYGALYTQSFSLRPKVQVEALLAELALQSWPPGTYLTGDMRDGDGPTGGM